MQKLHAMPAWLLAVATIVRATSGAIMLVLIKFGLLAAHRERH